MTMDEIDKKIKWCFDNNACIAEDDMLARLSEGNKMFEKCASCQSQKTGEGYGSVPPSAEWIAEDEECSGCECLQWFKEHSLLISK